jgi:hypothetical protein
MKPGPFLVCAGYLLTGAVLAQSPVSVMVGSEAPGAAIPADFIGLSFETSNLLPDQNGKYLFSAENKPLITLFREIGIKSLRIGGGTAELANYPVPGLADIDRLFAFAEAADAKVIYTLRLLNGNKANAAAVAKYIAEHYQPRLACFSLGNEPDWHAYHTYPRHALDPAIYETTPGVPGTAYPSYLAQWRDFAATVVNAAPGARFGGPDASSNYPASGAKDTDYQGESWTARFADDEKGSGIILHAFQHDYVGQSAAGVSARTAIHAMLSRDWVATQYPALYHRVLARAQSDGLSYRMTECNDYTGGVDGASNAFASALWALDYMHWHAAHQASGVNFHNKRWIYTCTLQQDSSGTFRVNPKAYGLKAFALGSRGRVESLTLSNPDSINLTAYAVRGAGEHYVTLINKEHGSGAREAKVTLAAAETATPAEVIFLAAPHGDAAAKTGVTLGGEAIKADRPWLGKWSLLPAGRPGQYAVKVPATSAAIVRIPAP